jgi:hypothetical protein
MERTKYPADLARVVHSEIKRDYQASIEGTGYLATYKGYQKIAELRVNKIIRRDINIFQKGQLKNR